MSSAPGTLRNDAVVRRKADPRPCAARGDTPVGRECRAGRSRPDALPTTGSPGSRPPRMPAGAGRTSPRPDTPGRHAPTAASGSSARLARRSLREVDADASPSRFARSRAPLRSGAKIRTNRTVPTLRESGGFRPPLPSRSWVGRRRIVSATPRPTGSGFQSLLRVNRHSAFHKESGGYLVN